MHSQETVFDMQIKVQAKRLLLLSGHMRGQRHPVSSVKSRNPSRYFFLAKVAMAKRSIGFDNKYNFRQRNNVSGNHIGDQVLVNS